MELSGRFDDIRPTTFLNIEYNVNRVINIYPVMCGEMEVVVGRGFGKSKEKSYGAVIINEKGEFLLIKHQNGAHWDFPKGHKENDETDRETAIREVLEETGLKVRLIDGFKEKSRYSPIPSVEKQVTFYLGFSMGKVSIQEDEVMEYEYLPYEEARVRITFEESKEVIKAAKLFIDTYLQSNED